MVDTTDLKSVSKQIMGSSPIVGNQSGEIGKHAIFRI